jgi:GTPase-activating protein BEM2
MNEWMVQGGGTQDVLDDASLYNGIQSFLDDNSRHAPPTSPAFDNFAVQQAWSAYEQRRKSYVSTFVAQTMRPTSRDGFLFKPSVGNVRPQNMGRDPPDIDRIDPEQLVESLDSMGAAAFSNISEEVRLSQALD